MIKPLALPEKTVLERLGKAKGVLEVSRLPALYDYGKIDGPALFSTVEEMVRFSRESGLLRSWKPMRRDEAG